MNIAIKTIILYAVVILCLRLMGKRQIGELQPSELVMTLLVSEIAAVPLQSDDVPIKNAIIPLSILILFEFTISFISIKSVHFRNLIQGSSVLIIRNGVVDQKQLKRLRYTLDDVMEELRKNDVWNIDDVQYAFAETDGTITILQKPEKRQVTPEILGIQVEHDTLPITVIDDGVIEKKNLKECNMTEKKLNSLLKEKGLDKEQILLLEMTCKGISAIILKEN